MPKKLLVLMVAALLVLTAGACGSPEEEGSGGGSSEGSPGKQAAAKPEIPTAVETVQVAYRETAAEQTARTSFQMTMTGPAPPNASPGASASASAGASEAPENMTMSGEGVMDFSGEASVMSMRMDMMGTMEMRQIDDTVYVKMPEGFAAQMPEAKPWVRMNLDEVYGGSGAEFGEMQGGVPSDPTRQLEYLRGVSDSVEKIGTEQVRGVKTTRYEATIDMRKEAANLDGEAREAYEDMLRQTGMEELPVEIWLDDQNRVRRYAMDVKMDVPEDASGAPQDGGMRMRIVAEYYDFGAAVDVQAPPRDQTMDGSKFMPAQQSAVAQ